MNNTKIEWCDSTWNPVTGCLHGCEYCYAKKQANRFKGFIPMDSSGATGVYYHEEKSPLYEVCEPLSVRRKNGKTVTAPYPFGFQPTLHRDRLDEPKKRRKPRAVFECSMADCFGDWAPNEWMKKWKKPRTIFVCSMADLFGEWVPDEWIEEVFAACKKAPQHTYLFLTKSPSRYLDLADKGKLPRSGNMWYGSSVTGEHIAHFGSSGRYNTFLSIEPLLFPVNMEVGSFQTAKWIIIGAETGNRKNKVVPQKEWIDHIVTYCDEKGIPVFMKNSLIPIVGEKKMRREFPWERSSK